MISEAAKTFLEFLKLAPRYLIALGVMSAFFLFSSERLLKFIGVFEFAQNNRALLGFTIVVSISLFVVSVLADSLSFVKSWWKKRTFYKSVSERLNCLTEDEKQILRFYISNQTRANVLRYDDGVVQGLVSNGIIYQSSPLGNMLEGFAHNISDFAWSYLHANPQLLDGFTKTSRTDKRASLW